MAHIKNKIDLCVSEHIFIKMEYLSIEYDTYFTYININHNTIFGEKLRVSKGLAVTNFISTMRGSSRKLRLPVKPLG